MTAALLAAGAALDLILRATLLLVAAWAAAALLRKAGASAAARHLAWLLGIFALLALPLAWWLAPPLRLPILGPETAIAADFAPPAGVTAPVQADAPEWSLLLLLFYLAGAAAVMLRFALSRYLVARLWREAEPAGEVDWQKMLAGVSLEMGLSRPAQLRIARGPAMPMTWGTLAPRILLPAEARNWPADQRRLVLLHELAHVARRDSFGRSAATLACALYWFHPGAWFAARRLRLEQEHAADDCVLNAGARPKIYARSLLELAFSVDDTRWSDHVAAMAGMCQLERRMVSITGTARREAPGLAFHAASAAITALTVLAVAAALPVSRLPAPSVPAPFQNALPVPEPVSAPAAGASGLDAQTPDLTAITASLEGPAPGGRGFEAPPAAAPLARAEAPVRFAEAQPVVSAAQDQETAALRDVPPPARQLGPVGPILSQLPEEQDTDPRIPAALRGGRDGDPGMKPAASRVSRGGTLITPRLILGSGQTFPW